MVKRRKRDKSKRKRKELKFPLPDWDEIQDFYDHETSGWDDISDFMKEAILDFVRGKPRRKKPDR